MTHITKTALSASPATTQKGTSFRAYIKTDISAAPSPTIFLTTNRASCYDTITYIATKNYLSKYKRDRLHPRYSS